MSWIVVALPFLALLITSIALVIFQGWYAQALLVIALLAALSSSILGIIWVSDSNWQAYRTPGATLLAGGVVSLSVCAVAAAGLMTKHRRASDSSYQRGDLP